MIIGINGKIGSGKDTVGMIIQHLIAESKGSFIQEHQLYKDALGEERFTLIEYLEQIPNSLQFDSGWEIKKFAAKLKQIASILSGIPIEKFEDQEFKKTLMGSEWDYKLDIFEGKEPFMKYVRTDSEPMIVREFLQKLGTEAMRNGLHTNVWVNALFAEYKIDYNSYAGEVVRDSYPNWIITDMRFPNEMEAVKIRNGITIRIKRLFQTDLIGNNKVSWIPIEKVDCISHPSETALDDVEFNYEIINDGTIEELIEKVREILIKEKVI